MNTSDEHKSRKHGRWVLRVRRSVKRRLSDDRLHDPSPHRKYNVKYKRKKKS